MNQHDLKILPEYFDAVDTNAKPFELRKNDRDYQLGDWLRLREWRPDGGTEGGGYYTGRARMRRVTYVLTDTPPDFGLAPGFAILGLEPL